MTTRLLLALLAVSFAFAGTACRSTKVKKDKFANTPAAEMEASFKQRWLDKRSTELEATGLTPEAARQKAESEFSTQFEYLRTKKK